MPGLDGYTTAELIRRRERSRRIPIIFVSAIDKDDEHIARAYAMGAVDYVFKPVDPVILRSKIAVLVDLYLQERGSAAPGAARAHAAGREPAHPAGEARSRAAAAADRGAPDRDRALAADRAVQRATRGPASPGRASSAKAWRKRSAFPPRASSKIRTCGSSAFIPKIASACSATSRSIQASGGMSTEYRWVCADGSHRWFLDRAVLIRDTRAAAGNLRQLPRHHRPAGASSSSCSRRRRWKRSAS